MTALSNAVSAANNIKEDKEGRARQNMVQNISRVVDPESKLCGHRKYGYGFLLYLLLNIANVVFNVWLMNKFLGGDFLNLGIKYSLLLNVDKYYMNNSLRFLNDATNDTNSLVTIFPRMTICKWKQFGTGGGIQTM